MSDYLSLPDDLPQPVDDGAAEHLPGVPLPAVVLPATSGAAVDLADLTGRAVIYVYPLTGRPGVPLPPGWDQIPGARGCTPESTGFRDRHDELLAAGAGVVYGLSSQDGNYQGEVAQRLGLPFALLSDAELVLAQRLGLPTFVTEGMTLYRRLTLVVSDGVIEHVFYPVFPADGHAAEVLDWLYAHPR